jgi:3-hydroxyacyl-[acyl-carrier-protein] dehydratase
VTADLKQELELLPHGREFRFLDRLLRLEPGKNGAGEYQVRGDEPFLRGHFPGEPLFPGVLLVEGGAQLAGTIAQCDPALPALPGLKLTAINKMKILGSAKPREVIRFEADITGRMANLIQATVRAYILDQRIMEGEIILSGNLAP